MLGLLRNRILFNIALVTLIAVFAWRTEWLPIEFKSEIARSLALEFGAGAWAYVHRERIVLSVLAAGAALAIFVWNPGGISSSNLMVRLGDYSYGLYLYAFPIQQTIMCWFHDLGGLGLLAASLPATLIVGVLSWHTLEKPALGLKSRASLITRPRR